MSASAHKEMRDTTSSFVDVPSDSGHESIKPGEDGPECSITLPSDDIAAGTSVGWINPILNF